MIKRVKLHLAMAIALIGCTGCSMVAGGWEDILALRTAPRITWKLLSQPGATLSFKEKVVVRSQSITEEILGVPSETFTYSSGLHGEIYKAFVPRSKIRKSAKITRLTVGDIVTLDGKVNEGMLEINSLSRFKKEKRKKTSRPLKPQLIPVRNLSAADDPARIQPMEDEGGGGDLGEIVIVTAGDRSPEAPKNKHEEDEIERWRLSLPNLSGTVSGVTLHQGEVVNGHDTAEEDPDR